MIELLDEGLGFYTEMLEILDKTYHIGLEQYYDVLEIRSSDTKIRCALVSAQKCLLCLGDLARYKEMIQNTSNYGKARQYYQKASHIDTRNAKPFNQVSNSIVQGRIRGLQRVKMHRQLMGKCTIQVKFLGEIKKK